MNKSIIFLTFLILLGSCKVKSDKEKITNTTNSVLNSIKSNDELEFETLIGVDFNIIGKDRRYIQADFKKIKDYYDKYVGQKTPQIIITNEYDPNGSRKVVIPFYIRTDTSKWLKSIKLELYFGPSRFVSLDKIVEYKIIRTPEADPNFKLLPLPIQASINLPFIK